MLGIEVPVQLIVSSDGNKLENYVFNAECTHLGCSVPWDPIREKFVCHCHGSQYDATGTVLRSPAPGSLKLAKVGVEEDSEKVLLEPWFEDNNNNAWLEDNFRTGAKPWWI
jgi:cytochrome b6-f complex iron-sulfur subunit